MGSESPLLIQLYLDEDVHKRVAAALRLRNFDVVSAHELATWALSDEEQLAYAVQERRTIFTYNGADYIRLHLDWQRESRKHCGIIVSDQIPIGETIRRLLNLLNRLKFRLFSRTLRFLHTHPYSVQSHISFGL